MQPLIIFIYGKEMGYVGGIYRPRLFVADVGENKLRLVATR